MLNSCLSPEEPVKVLPDVLLAYSRATDALVWMELFAVVLPKYSIVAALSAAVCDV